MYVLDSDYLSFIAREESQSGRHLRQRMQVIGVSEFATTIANYEEQTRGWLAFAAKTRRVSELIDAYDRLQRHLSLYCSIRILRFDELAATKLQGFEKLKARRRNDGLAHRVHCVGARCYVAVQESWRFRSSAGLKGRGLAH